MVKKAMANKVKAYATARQRQQTYESKCREYDKLEEELQRAVSGPRDKIDKAEQRVARGKLAAEVADATYREAITALDEARCAWEAEMERCATSFQQLDEERIIFTRSALWMSTNLVSGTCVLDDQCQEATRVILEQCDPQRDMAEFVRTRRTGSVRPAPVVYVNYYAAHGLADPLSSSATAEPASSLSLMTRPPDSGAVGLADMADNELPEPPGSHSSGGRPLTSPPATPLAAAPGRRLQTPAAAGLPSAASASSPSRAAGAAGLPASNSSSTAAIVAAADAAASRAAAAPAALSPTSLSQPSSSLASSSSCFVRVCHAYTAQSQPELSLSPGQLVRFGCSCCVAGGPTPDTLLIQQARSLPHHSLFGRGRRVMKRENATWWHGELGGRTGVFPRAFVELVPPAPPPPQ
jgi:hypothetical protein